MIFKSNAKYGAPADINSLRVCIHKIHGLDGWFLNCDRLGIEDKELKSQNLTDCAKESQEIIKETLDKLARDVELFCNDNAVEIAR